MSKPRSPVKPKFKVGDKIGELQIIEYLTWGPNPDSINNRSYHLYKTICNCGNNRIVTQDYLKGKRNGHCCKKCAEIRLVNKLLKFKEEDKQSLTMSTALSFMKPKS